MKQALTARKLSGKLVACVLIAACVAVGALGLVLPIIPGLLFLLLAALIAAKHFPWIDERLRRHTGLRKHLNDADRFIGLGFGAKLRIAGWLALKILVETAAVVAGFVANLAQRPKLSPRHRDRPGGGARRFTARL